MVELQLLLDPTIEPNVNSADTPESKATSFGTVTVPKLRVS